MISRKIARTRRSGSGPRFVRARRVSTPFSRPGAYTPEFTRAFCSAIATASAVRAAAGFAHHLVHDLRRRQVLGREAKQRGAARDRLGRQPPEQDGSAAFGRDDRVPGVLLHEKSRYVECGWMPLGRAGVTPAR